jgi:hypothetical protein
VATNAGRRRAGDVVVHALAEARHGAAPVPVHLQVDASPVSAAVMDGLARCGYDVAGAVAEEPGAGCLEPVLRVAHLLATADGDVVSVTAAGSGHVAVARLAPRPRPSTPDPHRPGVVVGASASEEAC